MKLFSTTVLFASLALGGAAYAQDPGQNTPRSQQKQESEGTKVSVIGCLTKGGSSNEYQITDDKSGQKLPFNGPAQLDRYVNQTVKLTGTQAADKSFRPETIAQVAPSCEKGKQ